MKKILSYLIILSLVYLAYGNTLHHSFHFDDIPSILEKPWIRGLDKIPDFIFSITQRPLVILSFNINYAISEFEVWSYHIFNITLHLIVIFLIYRFSKLILSCTIQVNPPINNFLNQMPILAALLFALHPLNTQAVTYISSRSSIMATVFYLASIIFLFKSLDKNKDIISKYLHIFSSVVFFLIGFLCKLIVISLPATLLAYHYYFRSNQNIKTWFNQKQKWFWGISGLLISIILYKKIYGIEFLRSSAVNITALDYFRTQIGIIPFEYFRKMLLPFNLSIDPNFQLITHWLSFTILSGIIVLAIYLAIWIKLSGVKKGSIKYAPEAFGLIWILITLSPTSSFVPLLDVEAEHRTYLPLVGFSIALSSILIRLKCFIAESIKLKNSYIFNAKYLSKLTMVCIILIPTLFFIGVRERNKVWLNEVSLWTDAKQKAPFLPRPYNNLGEAYDKLGNYDRAIIEFNAALNLNPNYFFALSNLGNVYGKKKDYGKAIVYTEKALQVKSDYAPGHYNLAKALHLTGNPKQAIISYRSAIKYSPYFEEAFFNLAFLELELKQFSEAIINFNSFINMKPKNPRAHFGLGVAYSMAGKQKQAKGHYEKAIFYDPEFLSPYINLANLNMAEGKIEESKKLLMKVLSKNPDLAGAYKNLGLIFLQENDLNNASKYFKGYLRLMPLAPDALQIQSFLKNKN